MDASTRWKSDMFHHLLLQITTAGILYKNSSDMWSEYDLNTISKALGTLQFCCFTGREKLCSQPWQAALNTSRKKTSCSVDWR